MESGQAHVSTITARLSMPDRLAMCSLAARGLWAELRPRLRRALDTGIEMPPSDLARLVRAEIVEVLSLLQELRRNQLVTGDVDGEILRLKGSFDRPARRRSTGSSAGLGQDREPQASSMNAARTSVLPTWTGEVAASASESASGVTTSAGVSKEDARLDRSKVQRRTTTRRRSSSSSACCAPSSAPGRSTSAHQTESDEEQVSWTRDGGWGEIPAALLAAWKQAYPSCDISVVLQEAHAWLLSNPSKVRKGCKARLIRAWLARKDKENHDKHRQEQVVGGTQSQDGGQGGSAYSKSISGAEPPGWDRPKIREVGRVLVGSA